MLSVSALEPGAEYAAYRSVLAAEAQRLPTEWSFKSAPAYRQILEHVSPEQGNAYLEKAHQSPLWGLQARLALVETALFNDSLGKPIKADYASIGIFCSPTNLRYLCQALDILEWIKHLGLNDVQIVEIGGGYGGLALFLKRFAKLARVSIAGYTIVDLPEAGALQRRYADELGIALNTVDATDALAVNLAIDPREWFLVSAYGFSEFSAPIREWYQATVIRHCAHGYLVWNMIPVYEIAEGQQDEPEVPLTGPGNRIVRF